MCVCRVKAGDVMLSHRRLLVFFNRFSPPKPPTLMLNVQLEFSLSKKLTQMRSSYLITFQLIA